MKSNKTKYGLALVLLTLSVMAIPKVQTFSESILGPKTAQAIGIDQKDVTIMPGGIITSNTINVQVPQGSVGAGFGWGKGGATRVMKADNSGPASSVGTTADQNWAPSNKPNSPVPIYSITKGSSYRLTNVGRTTDNQAIDMIITVTGVGGTSRGPTAAAFVDSAYLGGETDPYHSIAVLASGYHSLTTNIKYVKAGTQTPITITSGTYWSDIDIKQGVNENQSNQSVIVPPLAASKIDIDGRVIYSTTMDDANGMNDPNIGAYIGIGTGSEFNMTFYNPYTGGKNSPIGDLSVWGEFRYDLFGNFDNIRFPSTVTDPEKTVTDIDESKVPGNSSGLTVRAQEYDMSIYIGPGSGPDKLILRDTFPKEFKTDLSKVKITGKGGKDVTSLFDLKLDGQNFTATMKASAKGNADLILTRVNVNVKGTLPDWAGVEFKNKAIWTSDKDLPTNEVSTVTPSKPEVVKSVSVDNGNSFAKADTPETAGKVEHNKDSYIWKLDYTLSNYTNYTGIQLIDQLETIQVFNQADFKVYDVTGTDVTSKGAVTTKANGTKTNIVWTASPAYIKEVNTKFGLKSKEKPKFTTTLKTDISKASLKDKESYTNNKLGYIIIPNTGTLIESDHTGSVNVNSNPSHVTFPNELTDPKKTVSDDDEKDVESNNVGLNIREQTYNISVKTSKGYGFNVLELSDTFPKEFKSDLSKVKITNAANKDITSYFTLTLDGQKFKAVLKDEFKTSVDLKGTTINAAITGTLPKWLGEIFYNDALWVADEDKPTNKVETYEPSEPKVEKSISVNDGKDFNKADTPETASGVENRPDSYIWKLDFTLSNYTKYTGIQFIDHMESLQAVKKEDVKIFDMTGADITSKGVISTANVKGKTDVKWVASKEYVNEVNTKFGPKSKEVPKFSMTIKTDVKDALNSEETKYFNKELGYVVIPNKGSLIETDHTGDVLVESNPSHVKFPKPGESTVSKMVALDGTDPLKDEGWNQTLELAHHDELYSYKSVFKLSKDFNYDNNKLVLTDRYENIQKYDAVKIIDSTGKDRTEEFKFTESKENENRTTNITAIPKVANTFDDKGETLIMVISGVTWKGAVAKDELFYLEPNETGTIFDDKNPFKEGVTIPNISNMKQISSIPPYSTDQDTERTYVNLTINPSIVKNVEDDSLAVIDPKDAVEDVSIEEAVAGAQDAINKEDEAKASEDKLKELGELRKVLLDEKATPKDLLDQTRKLLK